MQPQTTGLGAMPTAAAVAAAAVTAKITAMDAQQQLMVSLALKQAIALTKLVVKFVL